MNCPACGHEAHGRFCTMCGARVDGLSQAGAMPSTGPTWPSTLTTEQAASITLPFDAGATRTLSRADREELAARLARARSSPQTQQVAAVGSAATGEGMAARSDAFQGAMGRQEEARLETPHFHIRCPAHSFAAQNRQLLGDRLERAYETMVELLGDGLRTDTIDVWLSDVLTNREGRRLDQGGYVLPSRMQIHEVYRPDAPGDGLERSVLLVLLATVSGGERLPPPLIVDGLLACAMQRLGSVPEASQLMPTLVAAQERKELPALRALLGGETPETQDVYLPAAAGFVDFLLRTHGAATFTAFLHTLQTREVAPAIQDAYQGDLDALDEEWRKTFKATAPGGVLHFLSLLRPYLRHYRRQVAEIVLYLVLAVAFSIGLAKTQGILLDRALIPRDQHALAVIIAALVAAFIVVLISSTRQSYVSAYVSESIVREMRLRMFTLVQRLHPGFFDTMDTGDVISRMTSDLAAIETALTGSLTQGLRMILTVVAALIVIFVTDWRLAIVAVIGIPLFFVSARFLGPATARASMERQQNLASTTSALQENLGALPVVQAFGLQSHTIDSFGRGLDTLFRSSLRLTFLSSILSLSATSVAIGIQLVVLGIGGYLVTGGNLTAGTLFAFLALTAQIIGPMLNMSSVIQGLQQASGAMDRVDELLKASPEIVSPPQARSLEQMVSGIQFEGVTFSYADGQPVLQDLTLEIPVGARVALVGPSGCGKSTVLQLLLRFYDPQRGRIRIGDADLRVVHLDAWRERIAVVFQESVLFNLSIRENIRLGNPAASDEEVEAAARAAEIHDLVVAMPEGYDTVVGERGGRLSGGQRQRIAIARALIRRPAILLLDEATSALDPRTEASINETLDRLPHGCTTISVTHRLAAAASADRIYVLDRGRLVEEGRHDELLRRDGLYAALWQEQVGGIAGGEVAEIEITRLGSVPLLAGLPPDLLRFLARRLSLERHTAGDVIIRRGDPGDRLSIIERGTVEVFAATPAAGQRPLAVLREGDHFGEIALLYDTPRTATIRARTPVQLYSLQKEDFNVLLAAAPELRDAMTQTMTERARLSARD